MPGVPAAARCLSMFLGWRLLLLGWVVWQCLSVAALPHAAAAAEAPALAAAVCAALRAAKHDSNEHMLHFVNSAGTAGQPKDGGSLQYLPMSEWHATVC
jgi:hypothetical protein